MPTTIFSDASLTFPQYKWNIQNAVVNNITTGNAPSPGSSNSGSESSNSEIFHESSNSPLRSPDTTTPEDVSGEGKPYLQIIEEPSDKFRFRYPTEMHGTHGTLTGNYTKSKQKVFPKVKLCNYKPKNIGQPVIVHCTLYTADINENDRIPHVHHLVNKTSEKEDGDPLDVYIMPPHNVATFSNMTILYTKKHEQVEAMVKKRIRRMKKLYPNQKYNPPFTLEEMTLQASLEVSHMNMTRLNRACLRFDAFINNESTGQLMPLCPPVYSRTISNIKNSQFNELRICKIDKVMGTCLGNDEVFIFVEKVNKKNIKVRFFELDEDQIEKWEDFAEFKEEDVHYQFGIAFRTPKYKDPNITQNVVVHFQLYRPSDKAVSEPRDFEYTPNRNLVRDISRKRPRMGTDELSIPTTVDELLPPPRSIFSTPSLSMLEQSLFSLPSLGLEDETALNDIFQEFPVLPMEEGEEEVTSSLTSVNLSFNQVLENLPSADSEAMADFVSSGRFEEWCTINGESDTLQQLKLGQAPGDDLVTDGIPSLNKFAINRNEPEMGPTIRRSLNISKDDHNSVNQGVNKFTADNIVQKVHSALSKLIKLKRKMSVKRFKNCILRLFSARTEEHHDCVFHIMAAHKEELDEQTESFLKILKAYGINKEIVNQKNHKREAPLHVAILKGSIGMVQMLVDSGADVNARCVSNNTPVHLVNSREDTAFEALGILLSKMPNLSTYNENGFNALHLAVSSRKSDLISSLLIKSEEDNCPNSIINSKGRKCGNTALHIAVQAKYEEVVSLLLNFEGHIDVNIRNFNGKTPLEYVYGESDPVSRKIVGILIAHGADPTLVSRKVEKMEYKDELENNDCDSDIGLIDGNDEDNYENNEEDDEDSLAAYKMNWKSDNELRLFDAETVAKLCSIFDQNGDWTLLLRQLDLSEDLCGQLKFQWSPTLELFKLIAAEKPKIPAQHISLQIYEMDKRFTSAARIIDEMILGQILK